MPQRSFSVDINPAVLRWARNASGRTTEFIAERLGITEQTINQWESGQKSPAWTSLQKLAKCYDRPLAALLLSEPPIDPAIPPDFRTLPKSDRALSPSTLLVIRTARWLQSRAKELHQQLQIDKPIAARRIHQTDHVESVAVDCRKILGIELSEQINWATQSEAYRHWRESLDEIGILVFQFRFPVKEVRGFSLSDTVCPAIVVNEIDDVRARTFTLLHEYSHLLLQRPGICLPSAVGSKSHDRTETFCNQVAAAILIPETELHSWRPDSTLPLSFADAELRKLAARFHVSKYVVLYRFTNAGRVPQRVSDLITSYWKRRDASKNVGGKKRSAGGQSAVQICTRQRGKPFISLVLEAEKRGLITSHDAMLYLNVKLKDLTKLELRR
jgi:Zn-dependent peptidase ImmA (M78 family)/DNA-binding XRE family transcriptional regulator